MNPLQLALAGMLVAAASAVLALALIRAPQLATAAAAAGAIAAGAAISYAAVTTLADGWVGQAVASWQVPGGELVVGIDPLSAFFLLPLAALGALCAIYGRGYLRSRVAAAAALNLLLAAMTLVLVARHALLFLVAWEAMTLLAYLLVVVEHGQADVRRAGWVYLIASHAAVIALSALFVALAARAGGQLGFAAIAASERAAAAGPELLVLAILGFGVKAGVIGLHVWLPEAHAAAPSHVSALMSGVLIKLGVYGLLRATLLVAPGVWFGVALMVLGIAGALLGIGLALYQRDLKRTLAYSSVENVGIVLLGLGLGFWARAHGDAQLSAIAFAGGLLHVWNHAAMKGLLFLAAGSLLHGAGSKDLERLGGLLRTMPWTGGALIVGAVAIAALPPLNGFAGEWLLYRALAQVGLHGAGSSSLAAIGGAAALAATGGLAALCFVRLLGVALLGAPRSEAAARAHDSPGAMRVPMIALAAACVAGSLAAPALVSAAASLVRQLAAASDAQVSSTAELLAPVVAANTALLGAAVLVAVLLLRRIGGAAVVETWSCGYAAPAARMQYTGRAFAELLTTRVFPRWARPQLHVRPPEGLFPTPASFSAQTADPLTRAVYEPLLHRWADRFSRLRVLQQGNVHAYILYIVATVILGLAWVAARDGSWP